MFFSDSDTKTTSLLITKTWTTRSLACVCDFCVRMHTGDLSLDRFIQWIFVESPEVVGNSSAGLLAEHIAVFHWYQ